MPETALITGLTDQERIHLTELLLEKGYVRPSVHVNRIEFGGEEIFENENKFMIRYCRIDDRIKLIKTIKEVQPDVIFNLTYRSNERRNIDHLKLDSSGEEKETSLLIDAVRTLGLENKTRIYHATPSDLHTFIHQSPTIYNQLRQQHLSMILGKSKVQIDAITDTRICAHCGFINSRSESYCSKCNFRLPGKHASYIDRLNEFNKTKLQLLLFIILLVIFIAISISYL